MKAVFWLGIIIMVLSQISLLHFKQSNISRSSHISTFWAVSVNFVDFSVYLGINSFYERISKIDGNRKVRRFDVLYQNLTRKIGRRTPIPLINRFTFLKFARPLAIPSDVSVTLFTHLHSQATLWRRLQYFEKRSQKVFQSVITKTFTSQYTKQLSSNLGCPYQLSNGVPKAFSLILIPL